MTNEEILELFIRPHEVAIRKMHDEAIEELNVGGVKMSNGKIYNRVKSAYLNNVILEKAKPYFRNIEGFEIDERYDSLVISCSGILSKFRKSSKTKYPPPLFETQRSLEIIQGILFPDFAPMISLEIRSVTNQLFTEYERIAIIKKIGKAEYEIYEILPLDKGNTETLKAKEVKVSTEAETQIKKKTS
jgi:hypothetical protein